MANSHENDQFVVHHNGKWAVRGGGNSKVTKICDTQAEAKKNSYRHCKNKHGNVIVHNREGEFHVANSYGNDNCPPKDNNY